MPSQVNAGQQVGRLARMNAQQIEELCRALISSDMPEEIANQMVMRIRSGDDSVIDDIMAGSHGYPDTPVVFGPEVKFKLGVIAAIKRFKKKKTHNRTTVERLAAMRELVRDLSMVYERPTVKLAAVCLMEDEQADSRRSFYHGRSDTIVMVEKLSIITLLHEFAHALGKDEVGAVRWSVTLFQRVWPERFELLQAEGHTLVMPQGVEEDGEDGAQQVAPPVVTEPTVDEEAEALALMDDEEEEDIEIEDDEWIDEEFDDDEDEPEPEPVKKPRRKLAKKKAVPVAKPKAKKKAAPKRK